MPLAIKVDVDTDLGTRAGVLPLAEICRRHGVPALFLFSLGPDHMGRSIFRIFQPGFLRKIFRTRVVANYGVRALLHGTLLPAPHLGRRYAGTMRQVAEAGFEVGIHAYDHYRWQNQLWRWSLAQTRAEFGKAVAEFERIFGHDPTVAGAAGWQCSPHSLAVYDEMNLLYASDARGQSPFLPAMAGTAFRTPQIPTTLPTLDELLGRPDFPLPRIQEFYLEQFQAPGRHVWTIHAELEGLRYAGFFDDVITRARQTGVAFISLRAWAEQLRNEGLRQLPRAEIKLQSIAGRSGTVAVQGQATGANRN